MDRELKTWLLLCIGIVGAGSAIADLSVNAKSWPKQLPESEYGPHNYYGNGQSDKFYRAMHGAGSVTDEDQKSIHGMLPESESDRYYLKIGMHKSTTALGSIKNKSTSTAPDYTTANITETKFKKDVTGGQIGAGYIFDKFRVDVDYIFGSDINYNQVPGVFTAGAPDLTSKVTGYHLIANAYYEFKDVYLFKPFIGISAGLGMNKVNSTFTRTNIAGSDGVTKSKSTMGIDYGLQIGSRIRILKTKFNVSASYRYLSLGTAKWTDNSGTLLLEGKRTFNGFCLDLIYLL
jgi:opacity protein-like surface antigen